MDKELEGKLNGLEEEVKSLKKALLVIVVVPALFIFIFIIFSYIHLINELPINELNYYLDEFINFLKRCDGADCADWLIDKIKSDRPFFLDEIPATCGRIINGSFVMEDCSQW